MKIVTMKRIQSVLCALALAIALSPTVLAGDIHGISVKGDIHGVSAPGDIHGVTAPGDIHGNPSAITGFLTYIAGIVVSSTAGNIHG
jgi:hypothetical protein